MVESINRAYLIGLLQQEQLRISLFIDALKEGKEDELPREGHPHFPLVEDWWDGKLVISDFEK